MKFTLCNDIHAADSSEAIATIKVLVGLGERQMKHGAVSTAPALLAGDMILLSINDLLSETDIDN